MVFYKLHGEDDLFYPPDRPTLGFLSFGLAAGSLWALVVTVLTLVGTQHQAMAFVEYLETVYPGYSRPLGAVDVALGLIYGFVHGGLFGLTTAYLYYKWRGPFPYGVELHNPEAITDPAAQPAILSDGHDGAYQPVHPYTILIVANPVLEREFDGALYRDPILDEPDLFRAKIACIIGSLASSKMIRDDFLAKIRIISLFDPGLAPPSDAAIPKDPNDPTYRRYLQNALCFERAFDVIIEPRQRIYDEVQPFEVVEERLISFLQQYNADLGIPDVVFAVTASETHTRSSAAFTFDDEGAEGEEFTFELHPSGSRFTRCHRRYPSVPGMVAYSVWDNRLKTPLHEFAHAMSSTTNGLIYDEYYDDLPVELSQIPVINKQFATIAMDTNGDRHITPDELPRVFARYELHQPGGNETFDGLTDKARTSPNNWLSYVPLVEDPRLPCSMDFTGDINRFDAMIERFMEDRLNAKMSR